MTIPDPYGLAFPESQLVQLHTHPLIVEYFSENVQLLYWLERLKPVILKEWASKEEVKPCFFQ